MTMPHYLAFVGASVLLVLVPGPDMLYLLARCMAQGRRAGAMAALGINAGGYVHLLAAVTGLSAILMTSAVAFMVVKWTGAVYLLILGLRALAGNGSNLQLPTEELVGRSLRAVFWQGLLSDVLNPKVAIFFLALLPQFIDTKAGHPLGQLVVLGLTINMVAIVINLALVAVSASVTRRLRRDARAARWLQKAMGGMFIGLSARLAVERA